MRRASVAVALSLALAGCSTGSPPSSFGVNLTIDIASAVQPGLAQVALHVSGDETFDITLPASQLPSGQGRLHYVPGIHSGAISFAATALDAGGNKLGTGATGAITILDGQAVSAELTITTAGLDAGPPLTQGEMCPTGAGCAAGLFCVDGFCCNSQCAGACDACNVAGSVGTCTPIPSGMSPAKNHPACGPDAMSSCGKDGTCDGHSQCHLYPLGTVCKPSSCNPATNTVTAQSTCDGNGNCGTPSPMPCDPYLCNGTTACYTSCTTGGTSQCSGSNSCVNNSCGLKINGANCGAGTECMSTRCVDGVCCDTLCASGCMACNLSIALGTCTNVPSGQDPRGACPAATGVNAPCSPGGCDGNNACKVAPATTQCIAGTCTASSNTANNPAFCQANGTCAAQTTTPCMPYTCGASACNPSCSGTMPCIAGDYCDATGHCQTQKGAGVGCGATAECSTGLTCLDGVCCMSSACPSCKNCGTGGLCNITVAGMNDTTGSTCQGMSTCNATGSCLGALGSSCGAGTQCASGNCVDGVCCTASSCPACLNCGSTGLCNVAVKNADDKTANACQQDNSCDASGTCKQRWQALGTTSVTSQFEFWTAAGTKIYFANESNGGATQYFKSYDVSAGTFANESLTNADLALAGYTDNLVHANGSFFYIANEDRYYAGAAAGWSNVNNYPVGPQNGEVATTSLGNVIYRVGGRGPATGVFSYTFTSTTPTGGTWSPATGAGSLASHPFPLQDGCAAAFNGNVYVFGGYGGASANTQTTVYNIAGNSWTTLPASGNYPGGCYLAEGFVWRSQIVQADYSGLNVFNPATNTWATPVPTPAAAQAVAAVVPSDGNLYLIGWSGTGASVTIYKWVFN